MRVLLDQCLPHRLKRSIVGHDVATVSDAAVSNSYRDLEILIPDLLSALKTIRPGELVKIFS